jgi:F-type H+-transporting ATPase subunit b
LANFLNTAVLFGLLVYFGRRPIAESLRRRKEAITHGMQEAAKVQGEASRRLDEYERKLAAIDEQLTELREEIRRSGELERDRVLAEARSKRNRMEREARRLIEQELEAAREELTRRAVLRAMASARQILAQQTGPEDQNRLAQDYLAEVAAPRQVSGAAL